MQVVNTWIFIMNFFQFSVHLNSIIIENISITKMQQKKRSNEWYCLSSRSKLTIWTSLVFPWLRLCAPNAGDLTLIPGQETRLHLPKPRPGAVQKKKKLTIGEKMLWPCLIKVKSQPPKSRNHFYIAAFQKQDKEDFIFLVF